jgi:hypothetical protein
MALADVNPDSLLCTRQAWHQLAEHVLAPARYAATGRIGLLPAPGGFATPAFGSPSCGAGPTVLAVDLDELVVTHAGQQRRTRISTVAQLAAFVGIKPGAPQQVYQPTTALEPDAALRIDRQAAQLLADWYQRGSRALADFAAAVPEDEPTPAQLWPEHSTWASPPRGSTTASPRAMCTSGSLTCTSARSTGHRRAVTSSGTPRSARWSGTAK